MTRLIYFTLFIISALNAVRLLARSASRPVNQFTGARSVEGRVQVQVLEAVTLVLQPGQQLGYHQAVLSHLDLLQDLIQLRPAERLLLALILLPLALQQVLSTPRAILL